MARPVGFRAVDGGKHHGNKQNNEITSEIFAIARRLVFAAVAFFVVAMPGSAAYAQAGPFAGLAGNWSGGGTITLDDGSSERIRCRATYAVGAGGNGLNQTLTCASDSYKFNLASNVIAQGAAISGSWTESTRNVSGTLEGRAGNGHFQVVASAAGFTANISLTTSGNKQSVVIKSDTALRSASISLSRS
jgi:hypothetical protein